MPYLNFWLDMVTVKLQRDLGQKSCHASPPTRTHLNSIPETYLECSVIPNSRLLNILDLDLTKAVDELEELISEDRKLFIEP